MDTISVPVINTAVLVFGALRGLVQRDWSDLTANLISSSNFFLSSLPRFPFFYSLVLSKCSTDLFYPLLSSCFFVNCNGLHWDRHARVSLAASLNWSRLLLEDALLSLGLVRFLLLHSYSNCNVYFFMYPISFRGIDFACFEPVPRNMLTTATNRTGLNRSSRLPEQRMQRPKGQDRKRRTPSR